MLSKFIRSRRAAPAPTASTGEGNRIYAIGDIHGCLDELNKLLSLLSADEAGRDARDTTLIFLGDLVDRGPSSAGVIDRLIALSQERRCRFLTGNHEEIMLTALSGDVAATRLFVRVGGRQTTLSYGLSDQEYDRLDYTELSERLAQIVPAAHRAFLESFEQMIVVGDYAFVHAGIRPGVDLDAQRASDLRWIREPFLTHKNPHPKVIVHGHTVVPEVEWLPNRIGIDTGAYSSGRLSALGLEGRERWLIQT